MRTRTRGIGCHPGPAGRYASVHARSYVVWEGRTWHAANLHTGTGPRTGITTCGSAPFLRQLLDLPHGLRP